jgi:hypothetical protein
VQDIAAPHGLPAGDIGRADFVVVIEKPAALSAPAAGEGVHPGFDPDPRQPGFRRHRREGTGLKDPRADGRQSCRVKSGAR